MAETYFTLVINQKRTCDESSKEVKLVPSTYLAEVRALLDARGYDWNGYRIA